MSENLQKMWAWFLYACARCTRRFFRGMINWLSGLLIPAEVPEEVDDAPRCVQTVGGATPEPAILDDADQKRVLMVYQLKLDKQKARDQFRYTWCGTLWDKGCFALLTGLAVGIAVWFGNYALENYRAQEARERALTEERLKALTAISIAHSKMTRAFFKYSNEEPQTPAATATKEYKQAIEDFMHETNKYLPLLGREFDEDVSWYTACHRKFGDIGVTKCDKFGELASNLDNEFNELCHIYLDTGRFPLGKRMVLDPIPRDKRVAMTPEEYLKEQVKYRKSKNKNDKLDENLNPQ
jgi:hypothetical protein